MKPTLDEMCRALIRIIAEANEEDAHVLKAIHDRLSLEKRRRHKHNADRRMDTLYKQSNKKIKEMYKSTTKGVSK